MKSLLASAFCLGFALPAMGDISDSGNMTLQGQALIVGTATVSGNAFSVGSSTLAVKSGYVGFGTASPGFVIDARNVNAWPIISGNGTIQAGFYNDGASNGGVGTRSNHPLELITNNNIQGVITTGGNFGIGTTSPNATLQVAGTGGVLVGSGTIDNGLLEINSSNSSTDAQITLNRWDSSGGTQAGVRFRSNTSSKWTLGMRAVADDTFRLFSYSTGLDAVTVQPGGNVGIGTTAPGAKLEVFGIVRSSGPPAWPTSGRAMEIYSLAGVGYMDNYDYDSSVYQTVKLDGAPLAFNARSLGNAGFGLTNPGSTLHVNGGNGVRVSSQTTNNTDAQITVSGNNLILADWSGNYYGMKFGLHSGNFGVNVAGDPASIVHLSSGTLTIDGSNSIAFHGYGSAAYFANACISAATLRTTAPSSVGQDSVHVVTVTNCTDYDLYTSTGSNSGQWRNTRTGAGP